MRKWEGLRARCSIRLLPALVGVALLVGAGRTVEATPLQLIPGDTYGVWLDVEGGMLADNAWYVVWWSSNAVLPTCVGYEVEPGGRHPVTGDYAVQAGAYFDFMGSPLVIADDAVGGHDARSGHVYASFHAMEPELENWEYVGPLLGPPWNPVFNFYDATPDAGGVMAPCDGPVTTTSTSTTSTTETTIATTTTSTSTSILTTTQSTTTLPPSTLNVQVVASAGIWADYEGGTPAAVLLYAMWWSTNATAPACVGTAVYGIPVGSQNPSTGDYLLHVAGGDGLTISDQFQADDATVGGHNVFDGYLYMSVMSLLGGPSEFWEYVGPVQAPPWSPDVNVYDATPAGGGVLHGCDQPDTTTTTTIGTSSSSSSTTTLAPTTTTSSTTTTVSATSTSTSTSTSSTSTTMPATTTSSSTTTTSTTTSSTTTAPAVGVWPDSGPFAGGNVVTISAPGLGNGGDITNVTLCGWAATILGQSAGQVTVRAAGGGEGPGDVVVQSASAGATTFEGAYTYHMAGSIHGKFMGWREIRGFPTPTYGLGTASVDGKLYAIGGNSAAARVFDPRNEAQGWLAISNLPMVLDAPSLVAAGTRLYAIGGHSNTPAFYGYDTTAPEAGWTALTNPPLAVNRAGAAAINGILYSVGGQPDRVTATNKVFAFDTRTPAQGWTTVSNLSQPRLAHAVGAARGFLCAAGGGDAANTPRAESFGYHPWQPATGWLSVSNLPGVRYGIRMAGLHGRLYSAGGWVSSGVTPSVQVLNPLDLAGGWQTSSNLPWARNWVGLTTAGGKLYSIAGWNGSAATNCFEGWFTGGVSPVEISPTGGAQVVINGTELGNGGDITNVTLAGIAAQIVSQSATQVIVIAGATYVNTSGVVRVESASRGVTESPERFVYKGRIFSVDPPQGPATGGAIVLYGDSLAGGSPIVGVYVGGQLVTVEDAAETSMDLTIPGGDPGAVDIVIRFANGEEIEAVGAYTYTTPGVIHGEFAGWRAISNLPATRYRHALVAAGGRLYAIGGYNVNTAWSYDPLQPMAGWTAISNLPTTLYDHSAAALHGRIHVLGGYAPGGATTNTWVYDPAAPHLGWQPGAALPVRLQYGAAVGAGGKLHALGGSYDTYGALQWDPVYPARGWTSVARMPCADFGIAGAAWQGRVYAVALENAGAGNVQKGAAWFDPANPAAGWTALPNMPAERYYTAAAAVNGRLFVLGGQSGSVYGDVYTLELGAPGASWTTVSPLPVTRNYHAAAALNGNIYVAGGNDGVYHREVWVSVFAGGVSPRQGARSGGTTVTISGTALGDGSDISQVTLCGVPATIVSQSATQVVVVAGAASVPVTGDVVVVSSAHGTTVAPGAFSYLSLAGGTITSVTPDNGPAAGGNTVVIAGTGMGGGNVTNVILCGVPAAIVSTAADSVTVTAGWGGDGTGEVIVQSSSDGTTRLANGYTYNPAGAIHGAFDRWVPIPDLPSARRFPSAVGLGGKVYCLGGADGSAARTEVLAYDPRMPEAGWVWVTNMPAARREHGAAVVGSEIFVIGGSDTSLARDTVWSLDPTNLAAGWRTWPSLPATNTLITVAAMNRRLYTAGGSLAPGRLFELDTTRAGDVWRALPDLPEPRTAAGAVAANGQLIVVGGYNDTPADRSTLFGILPQCASPAWVGISALPAARQNPGATMLNNRLHAVGGYGSGYANTAWSLDPANVGAGWTTLPILPMARHAAGVAAAAGRLYVLGGWDGSYYRAECFEGRYQPGFTPRTLPVEGNITVTISGSQLGNGADITVVTLAGVPAAIVSQSATQVVVTAGAAAGVIHGPVRVVSTSRGEMVSTDDITYLGSILSVSPTAGPAAGGQTVTLSGTNLLGGTTVAAVYLCGAPASLVVSSETQLVVTAGANIEGTGDVVVRYANGVELLVAGAYGYHPRGSIHGDFVGWRRVADLPCSHLINHAATVLDDKVYVLGGDPSYTNVYVYDPLQPAAGWGVTNSLPRNFYAHGAAAVGANLYAIGGTFVDSYVATWQAGAAGASWRPGVRVNGPLGSYVRAAALGGKLYAFGGSGYFSNVRVHDPLHAADGWNSVSNSPNNDFGYAVASLGGRLYIVAAENAASANVQKGLISFDPQQPDAGWTIHDNMPMEKYYLACAAVNGRLFAIGGASGSTIHSNVCVYTPAGGWSTAANLPITVYQLAAAAARGRVYAMGGLSTGSTRTNAVFEGTFAAGVSATNGPTAGGTTITITGTGLGSGSDITTVTVAGVPAAIVSQSDGQVVVTTGAAGEPVSGPIRLFSTSRGMTESEALFTYVGEGTSTTSTTTTSSSSTTTTLTVTSSSSSSSTTTTTTTTSSSTTTLTATSTTTSSTTSSSSSTTSTSTSSTTSTTTTTSSSTTTASAVPPAIIAVTPAEGPMAGGQPVRFTGTGLGGVTNVTLRGIRAAIQQQTATSLVVVAGASVSWGAGHVVAQAPAGTATRTNGWFYHAAGNIVGPFAGWTAISNLPQARYAICAAEAAGKLHAFGGPQGRAAYVYDPLQPQLGWQVASTNLPTLNEPGGASLDGKLYAVGGLSSARTYRFDPTQPLSGWEDINLLMAAGTYGIGVEACGGKLYRMGGALNSSTHLTDCAFYDPLQPQLGWQPIASLPLGRSELGSAMLHGRLYVFGGYPDTAATLAYDPQTPAAGWSDLGNLPHTLFQLGGLAARGWLVALGGYYGGESAEVLIRDPVAGSAWLSVSNLPTAVRLHGAASVHGRIYCVAGLPPPATLPTALAYEGRFASGFTPESAIHTGGVRVVIRGLNLGSGTDVTNVTLAGITATLVSQSATQLVVTAGAAPGATEGPICVYSASRGLTVSPDPFRYDWPTTTTTSTSSSSSSTTTTSTSTTTSTTTANTPPVWTSLPVSNAVAGARYEYVLTAYDADGDPLDFSGVALPAWLSVVTNRGGPVTGTNIIRTVAGGGGAAISSGVPATNVFLGWVMGVAADRDGNAYLSAHQRHRVLRVDTNGILHVVAGTGTGGFSGDGGPATSAQLNGPQDVSVAPNGDLLIADTGNQCVRRIDANGIIRTVAGNGVAGFGGDGGPATNALLADPISVTMDALGNVYVADISNHRVRRIAPNGVIDTVVGTGTMGSAGDGGPAVAAELNSPADVCFGLQGELYVSENKGNRVRRVSPAGIITTFAGGGAGGDGGPATAAALSDPLGLVADAFGGLYIADYVPNRVRYVNSSGIIGTVVGTGAPGLAGDGGPASAARIYAPWGLALMPDGYGPLFIGDRLNNRLRRVEGSGALRIVLTGTPSAADAGVTNITLLVSDGTTAVPQTFTLHVAGVALDITNSPATVAYAVTNVSIGGVTDGLSGSLQWTNSLTGFAGSLPVANPFTIAAITLHVGPNTITVRGSNAWGVEAWDSVTISRDSSTTSTTTTTSTTSSSTTTSTTTSSSSSTTSSTSTTSTSTTTTAPNAAPVWTSVPKTNATANLPYTYHLAATDADHQPLTFSGSGLPAWLQVLPGPWRLTGTPGILDVGTTNISLLVTDGRAQVPQAFTLTVGRLLAAANVGAFVTGPMAIQIQWQDNNNWEAGYRVERRSSTNAMWAPMDTVTSVSEFVSYVDLTVAAGATYWYRIVAFNADGNGPPSASVSARTMSVPTTPANLTATAVATNRIILTWVDTADDESHFELQRRMGLAGAWMHTGTPGADSTTFTDNGLAPNTLYCYRLRAVGIAGTSAFTPEACDTTAKLPNNDCGYGLWVTRTNLTLDTVPVRLPATGIVEAVVGGTLDVRQTSPRGVGSVQRVVIGFRDAAGYAAGMPAELLLLYGAPGCPGRDMPGVTLPADFRAPVDAGSYSLWVEAAVTAEDPTPLFLERVRTNETATAKRLGTVVIEGGTSDEATVILANTEGIVGTDIRVPILINSTGGEVAVSFSLTYNASILAPRSVAPGPDAYATWVRLNTNAVGRVGVLAILPDEYAMPAGAKHAFTITFGALQTGVVAVTFGDLPTARDISYLDVEDFPDLLWLDGTITVVDPGYEGDVAPRPRGDRAITAADVALVDLILLGEDRIADSNEFRRADCVTVATKGNGLLTLSDRTQIRRWIGTSPLSPVGGPWAPQGGFALAPLGESDRQLTAGSLTTNRGATFWLPLTLAAQGNENALAMSVQYDPNLLNFLDWRAANAATNATTLSATLKPEEGRLGLLMAMPTNQVLPAGTYVIAQLAFQSTAGATTVLTGAGLADNPMARAISGPNAEDLACTYADGVVTLTVTSTPGAPTAPAALTATVVATNQINLAWTDTANNETAVIVHRRTEAGAWSELATLPANATSYADAGLVSGTAYRFLVEARNAAGSAFSDSVAATTWTAVDVWRLDRLGQSENTGFAADAADWDGDGIPNFIEYALDLDPTADDGDLFAMEIKNGVLLGTDRFMSATYHRGPNPPAGASVGMDLSTNLITGWTQQMLPVDETPTGTVIRVRVRSDAPLGSRKAEFIRMHAEPAAP